MQVEITLENYRCFPDSEPARITLRKGFTAFVGVNNSGKSSLLKFFYELRPLFQMLSYPSGNLIEALRGRRQAFTPAPSVFDLEELFSNTNDRNLQIQLRFLRGHTAVGSDVLPIPARIVLTIPRATNAWLAGLSMPDTPWDSDRLSFEGTALREGDKAVAQLGPFFHVFKVLSETLYIGPFRNAINVGAHQSYFDIQVGQAFIQTWRQYKTGNVKKNNEAAYKLTEDIKSIFEFTDLEVNPSPDDQTLQVFINGRSYKLPELGSGLTQFVLVLANAATKQPSYILIDEPELNLHPSLQLDFLTTLASYASEGILFGTHSYGLARASADSIYTLRRVSEGQSELSELEATPRLSEFLGELSFSAYRELGFNKVLLVEGVTDVKTIQQFLRLRRKDHQVVLLPLGGAQLINQAREMELQEIKRISENVSAVIDSERAAPGEPLDPRRAAFVETCERLGIRCHVLERRAIEN